jgi:hypothetical protein|tara:strand:+ start:113 stop:643 length:531 start_codon:yes stop_codon:yes gene_type:complete
MARIDDFKANLIGGGARANQFRVTITPPPGIAIGLDVRRSSFLAKASNLPGQTLGEIAIPFRGRNIYIAGDREFETWTTTFINDTDFMVRNAMERWMNGINDTVENTGVSSPAEYTADLFVEQLDRDDTILKSYIFRNAYPLTTAQIDVAADTTNTIEEFEVTWRYQHFEASGVNF